MGVELCDAPEQPKMRSSLNVLACALLGVIETRLAPFKAQRESLAQFRG